MIQLKTVTLKTKLGLGTKEKVKIINPDSKYQNRNSRTLIP